MKNKFPPILFSLPVIDRLQLPARAEILPRIESGELDHIDFVARVFNTAPNTNHYAFPEASLGSFASSFEGMPYLRNHDTYDIASRDGTILESALDGNDFRQTIRLTTRRGMTDLVEGKIDRFSIGWFYREILCSICGTSIFACSHAPGREYAGKLCELIFTEPRGKETSAVNAAAVQGTGIDALLHYQAEFSTKNTNKHEENDLVSFPSLVPLRVLRGEDFPKSPAILP